MTVAFFPLFFTGYVDDGCEVDGVGGALEMQSRTYISLADIENTSSTLKPVTELVSKYFSIPLASQKDFAVSLSTSRSSTKSTLLPIRYTNISAAACALISLSHVYKLLNVSSRVRSKHKKTTCAPL